MDFMANAEWWLVGKQCRVCDREVSAGESVRYDCDAGSVQVWCACCFDAIQGARREAFIEAAKAAKACQTPEAAYETLIAHAKRVAA